MKQTRIYGILTAVLAITALAATPVEAHTMGVANSGGVLPGLFHPFSGVDHVLAMVCVGLWAAHLSGHARWLVPASFVAMMAFGGSATMAGMALPFVEAGIALSVVALGGLIWARVRMPVVLGMALAGGFALFHGAAHGLAVPADGTALAYGLGFVAATALLHAVGLGLGFAIMDKKGGLSQAFARMSGGAVAATGVFLMVL